MTSATKNLSEGLRASIPIRAAHKVCTHVMLGQKISHEGIRNVHHILRSRMYHEANHKLAQVL